MGSVFLRGESWVIEYKVKGRTKREAIGKKGIATKTMAKEILNNREQEIKLGKYNLLDYDIPTLQDFSEEFIVHQRDVKRNRSWKKDEAHIKRWNKELGTYRLSEITVKHIDDYKLKRIKEVKAITVNRELQALRCLLNLAKKWKKFFGDNPVSESGLLKTESFPIRILSYNEEVKLIDASSDHLKPIIKTALLTAMRLGELLTLRWQDVDFDNNLITIREEISKSKKTREIPISNTLRILLLEHKLKSGHSGMVFLTPEGVPYSPKNSSALKRCFTTARKKTDLLDLRFHDLRHTAATRMAENGASIIAVKEICGHSDIKTTMQYFHPDKSLKEAVEILGNCSMNI